MSSPSTSSTTRVALSLAGVVLVVWFILSSDYSPTTVSPVDWLSAYSSSHKASSPYVRRVSLEHPIPKLMDAAEQEYRAKLKRQSKTLKEAVREYKRRYKRPPPKGFEQWFDFAQKNNFKMMDEFDGIVNDLKPFWVLSPEELRRRTGQVCLVAPAALF